MLAAHERVLRGEDLTGTDVPGPPVLDLSLRLEPWEPAYCLAEYRSHDADFPAPALPSLEPVELPEPGARASDPVGVDALLEVVRTWVVGSGGRADAVAVGGDASRAIATIGAPRARMGTLSAADALAWLAWAGAAGGANGRRSGAAAGRFAAWWAVAAIAGVADEALATRPDAVGEAATRLRWFAWDHAEPVTGWALRIAVEDPASGRAWALDAVDPADERTTADT